MEVTIIRNALTMAASEEEDQTIKVSEAVAQDLVVAITGIPDELKNMVNELEKVVCNLLTAFGSFTIKDQVEGTNCTLKLTLEKEATI